MSRSLKKITPTALQPTETKAVAVGLFPLLALLILFAIQIPLGQPHFVLRYTAMLPNRMGRAAIGLAIGMIGLGVLNQSLSGSDRLRRTAQYSAIFMFGILILWTFYAPPSYAAQHSFNLLSPSHDGAFVVEARSVESIREYVSGTFYERLNQTPNDMRGRRLLSNPPGLTVISVMLNRLVEGSPGLRSMLVSGFGLDDLDDAHQQSAFASSMLLALLMTAIWGGSLAFAYPLCRLWLPPAASAAIACSAVFNPSSVNYTPGKDCMQLFTVLAILFFWMHAYVRKRRLGAALAGIAATLSLLVGLIHVWIVVIVMVSTLWHAFRNRNANPWLRSCLIPFAAGGLCMSLVLYVTLGWNVFLTTYRVGLRYNEIQLPIITEPFYWALVGLPLFLLFVGPGFWVQAVAVRRDVRDGPAVLGGAVLASTILAMTYSYFFANNSETPRLWVPFIPLLQLGMSLRRSPFRRDDPQSRKFCIKLLALQLVVTWAQWALMDVRESEWRLTSGRMWD